MYSRFSLHSHLNIPYILLAHRFQLLKRPHLLFYKPEKIVSVLATRYYMRVQLDRHILVGVRVQPSLWTLVESPPVRRILVERVAYCSLVREGHIVRVDRTVVLLPVDIALGHVVHCRVLCPPFCFSIGCLDGSTEKVDEVVADTKDDIAGVEAVCVLGADDEGVRVIW